MSFRRRRRNAPDITAKPFSDTVDSVSPDFFGPSAPQFFRASEAAPGPTVHRSLVQRLAALDSFAKGDWISPGGYGGASPHASQRRRSPLVKVGGTAYRGRAVTPPPSMQARRLISSSWRAFNTLQFRNPQKEVICVRRAVRRNVLFAMGRAGSGRSGWSRGTRYRRTPFSQYRC